MPRSKMYNASTDQQTTDYIETREMERRQLQTKLPEQMSRKTWLNFNLFTPIIHFENTKLTYTYRERNPYRLFEYPGSSKMVAKFMVPPSVRSYSSGNMYVHIYHCRTTGNGKIDMKINSKMFLKDYANAPEYDFGVQTFMIPYTDLSLTDPNQFEIILSNGSSGFYWLSDISFSFENETHCLKFGETYESHANTSGAVYNNITVADDYRPGVPYLLFNEPSSSCTLEFFTPDNFFDIQDVNVTLELNHCRTSAGGKVNMILNGETYLSNYGDAPRDNFGVQTFDLPASSLHAGGKSNVFTIDMDSDSTGSLAFYWLSDVGISFEAKLPEVTKSNFDSIVKNWILHQRKNIAELQQIPRDDFSAWEFLQHSPSWFLLPFLPCSPSEVAVLISHFPTSFITVGFAMRDINAKARDFHRELLTTDLPKKNAYRHAYWCALMTRAYGADFAIAFSDAHEYAHVDLTIEGPFDHVTDKINNAVGVELASHDTTTDCGVLVERAWDNGELAWARSIRIEKGKQIAEVSWDTPLKKLASNYKVTPDFSATEKATIKRQDVAIPDDPPIHDEL